LSGGKLERPHRRDRLIKAGRKIKDAEVVPGSPEERGSKALRMALSVVTEKLQHLLEKSAAEIDSGEIYKLSNSLSGLIRSGVELGKWELEQRGVVDQVRTEFTILARQTFSGHPELAAQIEEVIAGVEIRE
jgi:hypothetical protein